MDLSLIVINHGTAGDVADLVSSIEAVQLSAALEIIVVNTIPEGAYAAVPGSLDLKVLQMPENRGFGSAVNFGIQQANGEYLAPMNADLLIEDDCFSPMLQHMRENPNTGVLIPRLLSTDRTLQYNARGFYSLLTILCRRTPLGRLFPRVNRRHLMIEKDHEEIFDSDWGLGAAMIVRRELLDNYRLFDERFFLYFEDVDLCARSWAKGLAVRYFPPATMIHHHQRNSAGSPIDLHGRHHLQSMWRFWRKHGTLRPAVRPAGKGAPE